MTAIGSAKVNQYVTIACLFGDESEDFTTGTVSTIAWINDAGTIKYLQAGGNSWGATPFDFGGTYNATLKQWVKALQVGSAWDGFQVNFRMTHSLLPDDPFDESYYITLNDSDDVQDNLSSGFIGDIDFPEPEDPIP